MTKRLRKKENNISSHSGHSNSLSGDVRHLAVEVNQTMKTAICIFLAVATFSVYLQVKDHEFIDYDDKAFISQNSNIKSGLSKESVIWAFTTTLSGSWEPITWLSHILGYQLYGSSSKNHHLINVFFHITNAVLLFIVLLRMTGALWQSGFVACMFALHPMNVESVAWLMERNMLLCTLFWLLTMLVYIHYTEKPSIKRYSLVILFFALGLMSKSMIVTLPFVLLMMDYWPLKRLKVNQKKYNDKFEMDFVIKRSEVLRLVLEKIPLLILSLGLSITIFKLAEGYEGTDYMAAVSFFGRLNNGMVSYLEYLAKTVWPTGLAVIYPHPLNTLAAWKGILCGMALLGVTFFSIRFIKKSPYFAFGWFWYLGVLVPVIGIFVQVGGELAMADRYAYLPLIGIFIIIAWGLPELIARWRHREKILSISAGIIISMLMATTWIQLSYWKNTLDLFKRAISVANKKDPNFKNPNHALLYNHLGLVFYNMGKPEESTSHYEMAIKIAPDLAMAHTNLGISHLSMGNTEEAISHYKTAIKFNPNHAHGHYNLGIVLFALGKVEEAISHYQTAIKLNPNYAAAHNNLGLILEGNGRTREAISNYRTAINLKPGYAAAHSNLGNTLFALGKTEEAIAHYKTVVRLRPGFFPAHTNLGNALFTLGKTEEAIAHYKTVIRLNPDLALANSNLGIALFALGKTEEAIVHYKTAIRLKPGYTEAHHNLGVALFAIKKVKESISHYKMAIKFKPDYPMAYTNLGNALFTLGKTEKAISHYKTAIRLRPGYTEAHYNLGNILVQTGKIKEAVGHYRETLRLKPNFVLAQKNLERALLLAGKMEKFKNQPIKNLSD
ncbi:MAG TPA: tetratricopeptide repeat protein [Nitrospina sp.]|nr:tetratricopeptide repeat protein [Nitrospina sp.]